jgi:serine/threonine protein kinase
MTERTTKPQRDPSLDVTAPLSDGQIIAPRTAEGEIPRRFGQYEDVELVGEGGMASVYRAYDTRLHRSVALKFLRATDPATKARLLHEARAQARVDDTRICAVYDVDEFEGRAYVVMQYIHGRTLAEAAVEMTLEEKLRVMHSVSEAIHAAHRAGLIHRDLKSTNIMVERSNEGEWLPYVLDFGLARDTATPGASTTQHVAGTPSYMAPEQVRGDRLAIDRRTDIWALGVTMYEILSGELPFQSTSTFGILAEIIQKEAVPLRSRVPGIPARPVLREAIKQYEAIIRAVPKSLPSLNNAGLSYTRLGQWERERGQSPEKSLQAAIEMFNRATTINPKLPVLYNNIGIRQRAAHAGALSVARDRRGKRIAAGARQVERLLQLRRADAGQCHGVVRIDPQRGVRGDARLLERGRRILADVHQRVALEPPRRGLERAANGLKIDPQEGYLHDTRAVLLTLRAEHQIARGQSPENAFAEAEAAVKRALEINAKDPVHLNQAAELYAKWARWRSGARRDASREAKLAVEHADRSLAINPNVPSVHAVRGRALLAAGDRVRALAAFEQAFKRDPDQTLEIRALRDEARRPR